VTATGIIDARAQVFTKPEHLNFDPARNVFTRAGTLDSFGAVMDPDDLLAQMGSLGVERLLVCAWHLAGGWLISNDDVADVVAHAPDRFVGVAAVNLREPIPAVRELERAVTELRFKALRLLPWLWGGRRATRSTARCSPSAWNWTSRSVPRPGIPAR
jgi:hypothetical protein